MGMNIVLLGIIMLLSIVCVILIVALILVKISHKEAAVTEVVDEIRSDRVSGNVNDSIDTYARLVPIELFRMLNIDDLNNIKFGEEKYIDTIVMDANFDGFSKQINSMNSKDVFVQINSILNIIVPIVYGAGGTVDKFEDAGLKSFFFDKYEEAINCAITMCEKMCEIDGLGNGFCVGLCNGPVMVGIVGHDERISTLTISQCIGLSHFLQKIGRKYYSRVIVTESFVNQINNANSHYNQRLLGEIMIKATNSVEKIYDFFDGDVVDVRNKKRKTKMMFEKGVNHFLNKNIDEARLCFIEVLKNDKADSATKEYIYKCDQYSKLDKENICTYLEIY